MTPNNAGQITLKNTPGPKKHFDHLITSGPEPAPGIEQQLPPGLQLGGTHEGPLRDRDREGAGDSSRHRPSD